MHLPSLTDLGTNLQNKRPKNGAPATRHSATKSEEGDGSFIVSKSVAELHKEILRKIEKGEI